MYNVSSIGRKTINPYKRIAATGKVNNVNPFFQEDSFSISDDAMILSAALNDVKASLGNEMNKLDTEKINALKQQIQSGNYNIKSSDVAAKLLS